MSGNVLEGAPLNFRDIKSVSVKLSDSSPLVEPMQQFSCSESCTQEHRNYRRLESWKLSSECDIIVTHNV